MDGDLFYVGFKTCAKHAVSLMGLKKETLLIIGSDSCWIYL